MIRRPTPSRPRRNVDGHASPVSERARRPGRTGRREAAPFMARTGHRHRIDGFAVPKKMELSRTITREDKTPVSIDGLSRPDERPQERNRIHFTGHTRSTGSRFQGNHPGLARSARMAVDRRLRTGTGFAAGINEVFELARACPWCTKDHDLHGGERKGYRDQLPKAQRATVVRGWHSRRWTRPEHRTYRRGRAQHLTSPPQRNPKRLATVVERGRRASLGREDQIGGRIGLRRDDSGQTSCPAKGTSRWAMMGIELKKWLIYSEPGAKPPGCPP